MLVTWAGRSRSFLADTKILKTAWMIAAVIVALYAGAIHPYEGALGINNSKAVGVAASRGGPSASWRQAAFSSPREQTVDSAAMGVIGGVPVMASLNAAPRSIALATANVSEDADKTRKVVRTGSLDLIVQRPSEVLERIRVLAESLGGFLVNSQIAGGEEANSASLTVRVPAVRFDEARAAIRRLSLQVESERIDAQDVTRQYVDQEASLRNLHAEEEQYLSILKRARTVNETLDVTEKLSAVRGQIEQQQAEFDALSKQIETVSLTIMLRTQAEAQVFGLHWRPLFQIKLAFREGLEGLASYASTVTEFVFFLPTVLLWLVTILAGAALAWRVLRWIGRRVFGMKVGSPVAQA